MRVTVCQLTEGLQGPANDWARLAAHIERYESHLLLLPEMPFYNWFPRQQVEDPAIWESAVAAHEAWLARLPELAPATVLGTRPVERGGCRLNEAFIWKPGSGYQAAHHKYYLPDQPGFWEATWYQRGDGDFTPLRVGELVLGFQVCTEMWFMERARAYGRVGVHLLAVPRATMHETFDKWLAGGRAAAVISGAYCISSNGYTPGTPPMGLGGQGWVIDPDGEVLGLTSAGEPFLTVEIDLEAAEAAKKTYPRYVPE
jgi:N-carbamoylputrescine amidase